MLLNVRIPVLETLVLIEETDCQLESLPNPRNTFLANLSSTIRNLSLSLDPGILKYTTAIHDLIRKDLNVEHLVIGGCCDLTLNPLPQILILDEGNQTLPNLNSITLHVERTASQ
jgi:hypothetical protein